MQNIINKKITIAVSGLAIFIGVNISSCSKNKNNEDIKIEEVSLKEIFTTRIQNLISDLDQVLKNAQFGDQKGQYPSNSRKMLSDRIGYLEETLEKVNNGTRNLNKNDMDNIILISNTVKTNFLASVLTEDFQSEAAELYVEGKSGGYIDFGNSPDYSSFSNGFTVEMWLKTESFGSFDYILSTFIDNYQDPDRYRYGWGVNYYGEGGASNIRMTYVLGQNGLYEPGYTYSASSQWRHLAFVWNPNKQNNVDTNPKTFKMYIDGVLIKEEDRIEVNFTPNLKTNLIGFNFTNFDGSIAPSSKGTNGRMKHVHIWNSVKNGTQLNLIKNDPLSVTGSEIDLVAGWRLDKTVSDVNSIRDLTDRHTAKIVGKHTWYK